MKKILFISLVCFLFCGCTVNYNMVVDSEKNISEDIVITYNENKLKGHNITIEEFAKNRDQVYKDRLKSYGYKIDYSINGNILTYSLKKEKSSFESINNVQEFQHMYNSIEVYNENNKTRIETFGDYTGESLFNIDNLYYKAFEIDDLIVNIQFHNKIIDSNADSFDEKTNTCTWKFNKKTTYEKSIKVELSDEILEQFKNIEKEEIKKEKKSINQYLVLFIIILFIVIAITFIIIYVLITNKNKNKI